MDKAVDPFIRRTCGDGMEQDPVVKTTNEKLPVNQSPKIEKQHQAVCENSKGAIRKPQKIPGAHVIYRPELDDNDPLIPVLPKGKLVRIFPKKITREEKSPMAPKREPRFVPFEPYKAAVTPLLPRKNNLVQPSNRNQLDINVLVEQMSNIKSSELKINDEDIISTDIEKSEIEKQNEALHKELEESKKQEDRLKAQLKFQVQVNSELKNLLVAAVGEDLQTRVNVLTEDKLQLARALLDTANNLSTHTEQIEYLAGQSEVWRSKFLASSVMVEELARWKADLSQKNVLLTKSNKQMLQLISQIREMLVDVLKNLKFLARMRKLNIPTSNIIDITAECLNISQQLVLHSGIGMPENVNLEGLDKLTDAERLAAQALENSCQHLLSTDEALKAIVGQAFHPTKKTTHISETNSEQRPE